LVTSEAQSNSRKKRLSVRNCDETMSQRRS